MEILSQILGDIFMFVSSLINPEKILLSGGLILLIVIVYAETGLFFGFFLPGDTLLFTAGLLTATGVINSPVAVALGLVTLAAILGDLTGYYFGRKAGPTLFSRPNSRFFKKKHLEVAQVFYDKYGSHAIVLGRFLPIVRTFAPIVAGAVKLDFKKFMGYNILGAILWSHSFILAGYFLAKTFPDIDKYLELAIVVIMVFSSYPVIKTMIRSRKEKRKLRSDPGDQKTADGLDECVKPKATTSLHSIVERSPADVI